MNTEVGGTKPLRVGVVGMGGIGNTHAACHKADALADVGGGLRRGQGEGGRGRRDHGVKAYYSLKEMLAHEELDIVDVSTGGYENGSWHFEPAMEALEAGKHVLCEKPLSNDIGEAREMVRYAAEQKLYLGCNLNHYFTPPAERARRYMDEGRIGELVYCLHKMGFHGGEADVHIQRLAALQSALRPHEGVPDASVQRHAPFLRRHHARAGVLDEARLSQEQGRSAGVGQQHPRAASPNGAVGYLLSQRGDARLGPGGLVERRGRPAARARSASRTASRS